MASFLIDEDLPKSIATRVRGRGIDAVHAVEAGLRGAADARILAVALAQGRAVVTADKEFGNVLTYPPHQHAGVILVRIADNVDPEGRVDRVCQAIVALAPEDLRGVVAVVDAIRLRIRRPPPAPT